MNAKQSVPRQIQTLLRKRAMSQQELADRAGITQGVVSRAANPRYGKLTINTLVRIANGFGMDLEIKFVRRRK